MGALLSILAEYGLVEAIGAEVAGATLEQIGAEALEALGMSSIENIGAGTTEEFLTFLSETFGTTELSGAELDEAYRLFNAENSLVNVGSSGSITGGQLTNEVLGSIDAVAGMSEVLESEIPTLTEEISNIQSLTNIRLSDYTGRFRNYSLKDWFDFAQGLGNVAYGIQLSNDIMKRLFSEVFKEKLEDSNKLQGFVNDPLGNVLNVSDLDENFEYKDAYRIGQECGLIVGQSIQKFTTFNLNNLEDIDTKILRSILETTYKNPDLYVLSKRIYLFFKNNHILNNINDINKDFDKIKQIYTGNVSDVYLNKDGFLTIQDEMGVENVMKTGDNDGLQIGSYNITIAPIFHKYGGPLNPVKTPEGLPIYPDKSILDKFFFLHDVSYSKSYFSNTGDKILISRILNKYNELSPDDKIRANITIKYFSSAGAVISHFFNDYNGSSSKKESLNLFNNNEADFFDFIFPTKTEDLQNPDFLRSFEIIRSKARNEFYNGFNNGLYLSFLETLKEKGLYYDVTKCEVNNKFLLREFSKIRVLYVQ